MKNSLPSTDSSRTEKVSVLSETVAYETLSNGKLLRRLAPGPVYLVPLKMILNLLIILLILSNLTSSHSC